MYFVRIGRDECRMADVTCRQSVNSRQRQQPARQPAEAAAAGLLLLLLEAR